MSEIIGVAANHDIDNYGTMLQALAMQRALESLGFQVETISPEGIAPEIRNRKLAWFATRMSPIQFAQAKAPFIKKRARSFVDREFRQKLAVRRRKFQAFREKAFPMSEICRSRSELAKLCGKYCATLVGSDQVWLPSNIAADFLTLSFVPDSVRKISYASSFGVDAIPKAQWNAAKTFLNRMDALSVRELSGQALIRRIAGREVPVVCDPSLLLTEADWAMEIPPRKLMEEPYIFCYFVGENPEERAFARQARALTGWKLVLFPYMAYAKEDEALADVAMFDAGPEEFLNLVRYASCVITDSFHATALSALHRKRVLIFNRFRPDAPLSTNTRIDSICALLGMEERRVFSGAEGVPPERTARLLELPPVEDAAARLENFRRESWEFLRKALRCSV